MAADPFPARTRWLATLGVASCVAGALAAAACGDRLATTRVGETTLVTGVAQPPGDDAAGRSLSRVAALLQRASLLRLDRSCRVRPGLAASVTPSPDRLTWTISLREGLVFHDGTPVDAGAVSPLLDPAQADPLFRHPGLRDVASVARPDARTLVVRLASPSAFLEEALASLEVVGGRDGTSGAGPFVTSGQAGQDLELEAFDHYYLGRPGISRLVLRSYSTTRTAWAALMRREIDFLYEVSPEATGFVASSRDAQVRSFLRPFVYAVGFNVAHPALQSAEARRRLAGSVNRAQLIAHVFGGRGVEAFDPVWPMHWAHDAPLAPADEATSRGAAALAPPTPVPSATRLTLRCLVPAGIPLFERLALHVQRAMLEVGVDLRLEPVPLAELSRRLARGDFDTYLLEMNGFGLGWTYWLWHSEASRPFVASGYRGADAALDALRHADSDPDLRDRLRAVRDRFREDPPAIFLCWPQATRAVSTRFALPVGEDRDILSSLARWQAVPEER
ncbi:MAG: ABC transporter substrate-binding protein [Vicinamibacterales bacterium]|nr:ABC transporter substrate-binding protein [Vicinamibacterales bacterium]